MMERVGRKQLEALLRRAEGLLEARRVTLYLSLDSNSPGDGRRYAVETRDGSRRLSPRLCAKDMQVWLEAQIALLGELSFIEDRRKA